MVLKFRIDYARAQTELELTEAESECETTKLFSFLHELAQEEGNLSAEQLTFTREKVGVLQVSQYFDIAHVNRCLAEKDATGLDGALLYRIVELIKQKKILGDCENVINFRNYIFEIYDHMFEDFCVLINRNMPIPSGASIRIKLNTIQHMFNYTTEDLTQDLPSNLQNVVPMADTGFVDSPKLAKVPTPPPSHGQFANKTMVFSNSQSNRNGTKRRRRRRPGRNAVENTEPTTSSTVKVHYPTLTLEQTFLFKDIIKAFRDETFLSEIDREARQLQRMSRNRAEPELWVKRKLLNAIWTKVVSKVSRLGRMQQHTVQNLSYMIGKYQQVYHLCVCVRYRATMQRANSYLEAAQLFDLFNYIHGKVMEIFHQLQDMRVPISSVCGLCDIGTVDIVLARNAFRDKQTTTGSTEPVIPEHAQTKECTGGPK